MDWTLMVEWDIRTIRMPGQPIEAGTPFGAMALLCAGLIFPTFVGICPLAGQGEGSPVSYPSEDWRSRSAELGFAM